MKTIKKIVAFLLAVSIVSGIVLINYPSNYAKAAKPTFNVGDKIEFGSYPQKLVETQSVLTDLNSASGSWKSMTVYYGNGVNATYTASYMSYKDVTVGGKKYRGIKFSDYIPACSNDPKSADYSNQDDNGYFKNSTYWFEYQPLTWIVLDPDEGIVISEKIIDSRAFQGKTYFTPGIVGSFYNDSRKTIYAHDYEKSLIRTWLNGTFYTTAFASSPKSTIKEVLNDNSSPISSSVVANDTKDKVYLPAYVDVLNNKYGFDTNKPSTLLAYGTDYADCMGLEKSSAGSPWWTRTTEGDTDGMIHVNYRGVVRDTTVMSNCVGVRPMMTIDLKNTEMSKGKNIDPNKNDWSLFEKNLRMFFMANYSYDYSSSSAFNQVIESILMCEYLTPASIYTHYFDDYEDSEGVSDPLNKLNDDYFDQFMVFPADKMDWVIRNVFNQSPDRSLNTQERYYYNGNYYVGWYPSGSNFIDVYVENVHARPDGIYEITIRVEETCMGDEEPSEISSYGVTAAFRETDGIKHWSFYKIQKLTSSNYRIGVFSNNTALSTGIGESFELSFSLYRNGFPVEDWKRMAIVTGNPKVISVSDYKKSGDMEYITITGLSEGTSTLTITDSESKAYIVLNISVYNNKIGIYTYCQNNIPSYDVSGFATGPIQTNFLDVNGLSINQYKCEQIGSSGRYKVSFNVYNSDYHYGSVDVFDKNGKWKGSDPIDKMTEMSSLYEWGEETYYLLSDTLTGKLLSYTAHSVSRETKIEIEVPEGGYFKISNDISVSPGAFLYNVTDFAMQACEITFELVELDGMEDDMFDKVISSDLCYEKFMGEFQKIANDTFKVSLTGSQAAACEALVIDAEDLLGSLRIDFWGIVRSTVGIAEEIFMSTAGVFGQALKACFFISKTTSRLLQVKNLVERIGGKSLTIFASTAAENKTVEGVCVVDKNNRVEKGAVLQAFRVPTTDDTEALLKDKLDFDDFLLYNICFVKNEKSVQPSGKVEVRIRIPVGADCNTSSVLRQEKDGSWTILDAHVEGDFIVFETDHFSLYSVVWNNVSDVEIVTMPDKLNYNCGDRLDVEGLTVKVTYSDGTSETLSSGFICSPVALEKVGKRTIDVKYGEVKAQFNVMVTVDTEIDIQTPSVTEISYGDTILLHAALSESLPDGAYIKWEINNSNFTIQPSSDGSTCKLTPQNNGNSEIRVYITDEDGNVIGGNDVQIMVSKAGFFQKIIAFFKKIFGMTKNIPQFYNGIF